MDLQPLGYGCWLSFTELPYRWICHLLGVLAAFDLVCLLSAHACDLGLRGHGDLGGLLMDRSPRFSVTSEI